MFLGVCGARRRQLLQISPPGIMLCKMCATVALCLIFLLSVSEGFFVPVSLRKQAPQTTFNGPHWIPTPTTNTGANTIQTGYGNPKDFSGYQQQQSQPLQQQQQQQPAYSSQLYAVQATAPKYEPTPFQSVNHYAYEGAYPNSYPQSVQLVPCLCPVNREVLEQQAQQLQQQTPLSVAPTSSSFPAEAGNGAAAPQPAQKKTT